MDISKLLDIMAALRDPVSGCPWDREQSFRSIAPYTIEEAYELADAVERDDVTALPGELGDLLFHIVFYARIAEEAGNFEFATVVERICEKLIRRHPHVFAGAPIESAAAQADAWETQKARERAAAGQTGALAGVSPALPALSRAAKLGARAGRVGFDWPTLAGVRAKVGEELSELDEAIENGDPEAIAGEAGDLMFAVANLCRHLKIDAEQSLRGANRRFETRFRYVETAVARDGRGWTEFDDDELDALWQAAKREQTA